jgi:hypothetical protein
VRVKRIVPLPLHVYLGIGNRIIKTFKAKLGEERVDKCIKKAKQVSTQGIPGRASVHELNGQGLTRWDDKGFSKKVIDEAERAGVGTKVIKRMRTLAEWLHKLRRPLLGAHKWSKDDVKEWHNLVVDIVDRWKRVTGDARVFPKLHMLYHTAEFAQRKHCLGLLSESAFESYHALFNRLYHIRHKNSSRQPHEQLRRALADATIDAVRLVVKDDQHPAENRQE